MAPGLNLAGDVTRTLQEKRKALPSSEAARLSLRQMANAPYRFSGPIEGDETVGQSSVGLDILLEDEHVAPSRNPGIKISRRHKKARKLAPTARRLRARLGVSARIGYRNSEMRGFPFRGTSGSFTPRGCNKRS